MAQKDVQLNIKVTGQDQINSTADSIEKVNINAEHAAKSSVELTKGIAGAFELASQAAGAFGEKNKEAFEKTIAKATQYIALSKSLEDVAKGFSSENLKGLTGIVQGFTKSGIAATLFGNVTKAAITSTGIGALVVGVGLLIANWDAVTKSVNKFIDSIPFLKSIKDTVTDLVAKVGSLSNLFQALGAGIVGLFTAGKSAVEEFNTALEEGKAEEKAVALYEAQGEVNKEFENSIEILKAYGNKQNEIFAQQKVNYQENIDKLTAIKNRTKEQNDLLDAYKQKLTILKIEEEKYQQKVREEAAKTKAEKDKINAADAEKEKADKLKLSQEQQRIEQEGLDAIRQLKINAIADNRQREFAQLLKDYDDKKAAAKGNADQINEQRLLLDAEYLRKKSDLEKRNAKEDQDARLKEEKDTYENFLNQFLNLNENNANRMFSPWQTWLQALTQSATKLPDQVVEGLGGLDQLAKGIQKGFGSLDDLDKVNKNLKQFNQEIKVSYDEAGNLELTLEKINSEFANFRENNKDTFADIAKSIGYAGQVAQSVFDAMIQASQRQLNQNNEDIKRLQNEQKLLDNAYNESINQKRDYEAELQTAQGARYDELLAQIDAQKKKESELNAQRTANINAQEALRKKGIDIQNKINEQQYAQAVVQSAVLTAQAILNALQTVPPASFAFAAIAAGVAAIQTAVVAANKPVKITYAEGGYTPSVNNAPDETGHTPVGVVHNDEWVAPKWMVKDSQAGSIISQLEAMRQSGKKFADGGFTTPALGSAGDNGTQALMSALRGLNLQVAVTEFNQVSNRVQVIEDRASI